MTLKLHFRSQAGQGPPVNLPNVCEAVGWVPIGSTVGQMLYAATLAVEDDSVEINPPFVGGFENQTGRTLIQAKGIPVGSERHEDGIRWSQFHDEIEVIVLSCLYAEKGINPPTSIEPGGNLCLCQGSHDADDLVPLHHRIEHSNARLSSMSSVRLTGSL